MWAQPQGPVHLSLTHDTLTSEGAADYVRVGSFFTDARPLSLPGAEAALKLLADAQRPKVRIAMLAGAGIEHDAAAARLKEIAERWSIPVATTLRAKGVFPEDHELSLGVFGYAGTRHATDAVLGGELDCLLVLGSGFNERDTMHWTVRDRGNARIIHVNTDMDELTANGDLGHVVPGSCHAFLDLMQARAAEIGPALLTGQSRRREWLAGSNRARGSTTSRTAAGQPRRSIPPPPQSRPCARRCRATPSCSSIPGRIALAGHYWSAYTPRTTSPPQSRADGLGDSRRHRRAVRAAGPPRRGHHRRRLHADARHRGADGCTLQAADHLSRHRQRRAR
jgi:acetolactate synthase-1/2/3 large subunit